MKTIDIGNYNLDIQENSLSLHKQLNDILFHKNKQENNNVFIRSNNRDTIVSNDILNIIQDARSRCSSVLYLRGTSIEYMNNAITK